ncbi:MAG: glycosyl hydrolase [Bacteroidota bacterium]
MKILLATLIIACLLNENQAQSSANFGAPKFTPPPGKKLVFIGQDLSSVGGLETFDAGYLDHFEDHMPAGVTTYTSIPSLAGLESRANWGAGTVQAQAYLEDDKFDGTAISIGLYLVGELRKIHRGKHDEAIVKLAQWIKASNRPIFLRIGYEFEGEWNDYKPKDYIKAWQHIVHVFDQHEVGNVAYVWQSAGINVSNIGDWYPGDEYVNWVGYSHFDGPDPGREMRAFALRHNKPIMIAEATPKVDLKAVDGEEIWASWYAPLLEQIYGNDQIIALAYINAFWDQQPMWHGKGWGDARIEANEFVKRAWIAETQKEVWTEMVD